MKRKYLTAGLILVMVSILSLGTLAYFTDEKVTRNIISSGNISIELLEWQDKENDIPFDKNGITGVMPGAKIDKLVEVKNTGDNMAYIRIKVDKIITLATGIKEDPDVGLMKIDFDKNAWELKEDGYFYYYEPLKAKETTKALFASVEFDTSMGDIYQNSTAKVNITAQAVQVANNGNSPLEASGWPQ